MKKSNTARILVSALAATTFSAFASDNTPRMGSVKNSESPNSIGNESSEQNKSTALSRLEQCEEWADYDQVSQDNIATYISDCLSSNEDLE